MNWGHNWRAQEKCFHFRSWARCSWKCCFWFRVWLCLSVCQCVCMYIYVYVCVWSDTLPQKQYQLPYLNAKPIPKQIREWSWSISHTHPPTMGTFISMFLCHLKKKNSNDPKKSQSQSQFIKLASKVWILFLNWVSFNKWSKSRWYTFILENQFNFFSDLLNDTVWGE